MYLPMLSLSFCPATSVKRRVTWWDCCKWCGVWGVCRDGWKRWRGETGAREDATHITCTEDVECANRSRLCVAVQIVVVP